MRCARKVSARKVKECFLCVPPSSSAFPWSVLKKVPKGEAIIRTGETYKLSVSSVKRMHKQYLALKAAEALNDQAFYEAEQRHYAQQSAIRTQPKTGVQRQGSKEYPPSGLDSK